MRLRFSTNGHTLGAIDVDRDDSNVVMHVNEHILAAMPAIIAADPDAMPCGPFIIEVEELAPDLGFWLDAGRVTIELTARLQFTDGEYEDVVGQVGDA